MGKLDNLKKKREANVTTTKVAQMEAEISRVDIAMHTKVSGSEYRKLNLNVIELNPRNDFAKHDTPEQTAELAESIERSGLLHNIVISQREDGKKVILSGERRYKAFRLLQQDAGKNENGKYNSIMCQVILGLDELEEMIILDGANLQARGNAGDEAVMRNAMNRYVENLKKKYGISDLAAQALLKKVSGAPDTAIFRNLRIGHNLIEPLRKALDEGTITRYAALDFCNLDEEEQNTVAQAVEAARALLMREGEKGRVRYNRCLERCTEAARVSAGERGKMLSALTEPLKAEQQKPSEKAETEIHNELVRKRAKLISKYDKMAKDIQNTTTKRKVRNILALEKEGGDGSILESLDILCEKLEALRKMVQEEIHAN